MSKNGTIVELTGKAWARGADGKIRALAVGDRLLPTDTLILAAGTVMQVALGTGPDAAVVTYESPDAGTPAIVAPGKYVAAPTTPELLRMLQQDLASQGKKGKQADLEERSGDGHRFVELVRIGETVEADALTPLTLARIKETIDPLGLEWGHPDSGRDPWPHGLSHDDARARNQTPVGTPDNVSSVEDEVVTGNVLGNDSDPEGRPLKVTGFEVDGVPYLPGQTADIPGKGTITINPDGSYIFVPVPDWHGSVPPITYTFTDGQQGGTTTSTLIIEITPVVDITPDEDSTHSGVPVTVPVLDNDTFENPDAKITGVTNGSHGTVTINPDGTVTYTPNTGYVGEDTFTYTVTSGGVTETTTVTIHVENRPPAPAPDTKTTPEDTPVSGNVLENDGDPDGDPLTVTSFTVPGLADPITVGPDGGTATIPGIGTITIHPNGDYTFTPVPDWNGTVPTITYTVSDGNDGGTSTSTLIITVDPVVDITPNEVETHAGDPITIPVLENDTFEDPARTVTGVTNGSHGTVTINPDGTVTYTPTPGYVGEDTFTYTVTSGGVTETTTVTVSVTNTPPVATPDAPSGPEDEPVTGNLIGGDGDPEGDDSDPDGDPLVVTEFTVDGFPPTTVAPDGGTATIPGIGTITIHPNGEYTFTPVPDWNGTVPTITYTVSDGNNGGTDTSTLIITVDPVNDTPVAVGALDPQDNEDADPNIDIDISGGFTDVDTGDTLRYTATGLPGGLTLDPVTGRITGTIDNSASQDGTTGNPPGVYTVVITATDEGDATVTQTFTWTVTNPAPVATDDAGATTENVILTVTSADGVLKNDSDPDGDALTVSKVGGNAGGVGTAVAGSHGGQFTINPDGSYSFNPNGQFDDLEAGVTRTTSVTYEVSDGEGGFDTATLTITVTGMNDAPVAVGTLPDQADVDATSNINIDVTSGFDDVDQGDTLRFTATGLPEGLTLDPVTGRITGTIDNSASQTNGGVYTVTVTATDEHGATTTQTFTWTVTNPAPVATDDAGATTENVILTVTSADGVLKNDSDPDGDALTVSKVGGNASGVGNVVAGSNGGQFTINPDGSYSFNPNGQFDDLEAGVTRTTSVTYEVSDGEGGFDTATLTITVTGVNDAPVAVGTLPDQADLDATSNINIDVTSGFDDVDQGDTLRYTATGLPPGLTLDPVTGRITGTIDNSASQTNGGVYTVTVTATDEHGATTTQTFTWTVTNPAPVATDDTGGTTENVILTVTSADGVLKNDSDPDGDALTVSKVGGNAGGVDNAVAGSNGGQFTIHPDGSYSFDPGSAFDDLEEGATRTTSVTYEVSDGEGGFDTATLTITVTGTNDGPVRVGTLPGQTSVDDASGISVNVTGGFKDVDQGDSLTYTATGLPPGLSISSSGEITGRIDNSASQGGTNGVYTVIVTATDEHGANITQQFTWTVTNPAPDAVNDTGATTENVILTVTSANGVLKNDSDPDGDALTVSKVGGNASGVDNAVAGSNGGQFTISADGSYTFNPGTAFDDLEVGATRTTSVTYEVSDGEGGFDTATLTITVTGTNDGPVRVGTLPGQTSVDDASGISVNVTGGFKDVDQGDSLTYTATGLPPGLSISSSGEITGRIDNSASQGGTNGVYTVTVTATDEHGANITQTFTWTVTNPAPVAADDTGVTTENTVLTVTSANGVLKNDSDPDGDALTVSKVGGNASGVGNAVAGSHGGQFTISADGSYSFDPDGQFDDLEAGVTRTTSVTYEVSDGEGGFDTATLTITVTGMNDAPVAVGTLPDQADVDATSNINIDVKNGFKDVDQGDSLTYTATGLPPGLSISSSGEITGRIDNSASQGGTNGVYTVIVTATDEHGANITQTFTWTVTNPAPDALPDSNTVTEGDSALIVDAANGVIKSGGNDAGVDSDPDGDTLVVTHVSASTTFPGAANAGTTITGLYGTLTLNADGSYTYTLDNNNAAVNALLDGSAPLNDVFYYKISDGEGGTDSTTLTIVINGKTDGAPSIVPVDANGGVAGEATVYESGLTSNGPGGQSKTATGTITVSAPDGLSSITIGGTTLTLSQLAGLSPSSPINIVTPQGVLHLTGYTSTSTVGGVSTGGTLSYQYELTTPVNNLAPDTNAKTESIALTVNGSPGQTSSSNLVINIVDDAPSVGTLVNVTVNEANLPGGLTPNGTALTAGGSLNIRTGADTTGFDTKLAASQTALEALRLTSGKIALVYMVSADGHTLTATAGAGGPTVFTVTLTNPGTASAGYSFTLSQPLDHTGSADLQLSFAFTATDHDADSANGTFSVTVKDDKPDAVDQASISLAEGGVTVGSGIGAGVNLLGNDKSGADSGANTITSITYTNEAGTSVTVAVPAGGVGITVDTRYGSLTVRADGSWSYTSDATETNPSGVSDNFSYTITDSDGSTDTATQPLVITDTSPTLASNVTLAVDEEGIATGSNPGASASQTGLLNITKGPDAIADVKFTAATVTALTAQNLTSGKTALTYEISPDGHTLTAKAGGTTVFTLTLNNPTDASGATQSVTMNLVGKLDHANANGENNLAITVGYTVSDSDSSVSGSLTINVTDDVPTAVTDTTAVTVVEGGASVSGQINLLSNDKQGADGAKIYQIQYVDENGAPQTGTVEVGGSTFNTIHGSLTVQQNGSWTYTSDSASGNGAAVTHTKPTNDTAIDDVFQYNVIDGDGDVSNWASQTVSVTDTAPTIGTTAGSTVNEANLATGTAPNAAALTTSGTLAVTKAADGIDVTFSTQSALEALHLKSGGVELAYVVSNGGHTLTATAGVGGPTVFTATITNPTASTAGYIFNLVRPLDHSSANTIGLPIAYGVQDADGDTATGSVTVTVTDDKPAATQAFTIPEDSTSGVTFNTSADGNDENITTTPPGHGTISVSTDGKITYTPNANYSGTDTFTYTTTGEDGTSITTTVTVTVTPVSDKPTMTVDAANVTTNEDTAVALGLNAPVVTDATDQNGAGAGTGDNPERLGAITLTGIPAGAVITDAAGNPLFTSTGGPITIVLSDGTHIAGLTPSLTMTTTMFEGLMVLPPKESHANFTVTVNVTSYEVNDAGVPLGTGAAADPVNVAVRVQAVTDPVTLTLVDGNDTDVLTSDHTIAEDTPFDLKNLLAVIFPNTDGNTTADLDGSELRWFEVSGFPVGTVVNGTTITSVSQVVTIAAPNLSTSATGLPNMLITPPLNYSGDATITITLKAQDKDADGIGSGATQGVVVSDTVTLNLHVTPVAGDVVAGNVTTTEDTAVAFLQHVAVTDTDGSEKITAVSFDVPTTGGQWTVIAPSVTDGFTVSQSGSTYTITFNETGTVLTEAQREAVLDSFQIKPPAHSSADVTITVNVSTTDTSGALSDSKTTPLPVKVTVTPVAEVVNPGAAGDSDGDGTRDATMAGSHAYSTAGSEDTWFSLNSDLGHASNPYDLTAGWSNQDGDELIFARLTPILTSGAAGDTVIGSKFQYLDTVSGQWVVVTYTGTPIDVPKASLGTLQFMAAPNVSGTFQIQMQTVTRDIDPDTGATVQAVSGSETLTNLVINPVADDVMLALTARVTGKEDTEIPLKITPTSSDPSETFNVTISGIPNGATITYGGQTLTIVGGVVTIPNFDASKPMTIMPPENSNEKFTLQVSAISVDGADTSDPTVLSIDVTVKGVADPVVVLSTPQIFFEGDLDSGSTQINLSMLASPMTSWADSDGSETLSYRITGLPDGFTLVGGSLLNNATGEDRVWVVTKAQFQSVYITGPDNFSGTQTFTLATVTTENDGDSFTSSPTTLTINVVPTVDAIATSGATLTEDTLTHLGFGIVHQNGDTDETLGRVWIKVSDASGGNFDLYLGTTKLADAGLTIEDGYYVLSAAQAAQLAAKGASNLDGALGSFEYKYEITDDHYGNVSVPGTTVTQTGTFVLTAKPVTDPVNLTITDITGVLGGTVSSDSNTADDSAKDTVVLAAPDKVTVVLNIDKVDDAGSNSGGPDADGSERVIRIVIDGVPDGVTVQGAEYAGGGRWIMVYDGTAALPINSAGGLSWPVVFDVSGVAQSIADAPIKIQVQTQDRGDQANPGTTVQTDEVTWHLTTTFTGQSGQTPPDILAWDYNGEHVGEDGPFSLDEIITAKVKIMDSSADNYLTVTIKDVPAGTVISGMTLTTVNGQPVWTKTVIVPAGGNGDTALSNLMQGIVITPPADTNQNNLPGGFKIDATLTTSVNGGKAESETLDNLVVPVDPVTDPAAITVTAQSINEGDGSINVTVNVSTGKDGDFGEIVGDKVYILATGSTGVGGGVLSHNGTPLATELRGGKTYYVVEDVVAGQPINLVYTPPSNQPGNVTFTVEAQTQETGSTKVDTNTASSTSTVAGVNNGVTVTSNPSTGAEGGKIELANLTVTMEDADGSEKINTVLLTNVPNGFLVYIGADAASAVLAGNAGGTGGSNTWVLASNGGAMPAYVAIVPPAHWSGTLSDLVLTVESGEISFTEKLLESFDLGDVTVTPVADGATMSPVNTFGKENTVLALNLNASMKDPVSVGNGDAHVETATVKLTGLGEFASFYVGNTQITSGITYANGVYTITGLTQDQLTELGFKQASSSLVDQDTGKAGTQIGVEIFTVDGTDVSPSSGGQYVTVNSQAQAPTGGDDHLIWTGNAINAGAGTDTVELRTGEVLSGSTLDLKLDNVEVLEMRGNTIESLSAADVLGISSAAAGLTIKGDAGDHLTLGAEWTLSGSGPVDGYDIYTALSGATQVELRVEHTIHID